MRELKKILHVDDDGDILEITRMALQIVDDFELRQFDSGPAALEAVDETQPDLLLLDVMMPGMTGPELWESIRTRPGRADIPVIFVTAKAESRVTSDLRDRGALDVVTKPFDPMTLGAQIRTAWARL
ncbi:response regulator [Roseibacterium sp. SDUM158017]|uniref:response regulator n=1 Tax=Roseicyclus salinarum TaxID=3036773 RepID=UPI0024151BD9|nr:response regulator [Roseibacterium sp. SDUM158017]MDG4649228.1 response regulator [Roseibacterium sp. SDUM158017]